MSHSRMFIWNDLSNKTFQTFPKCTALNESFFQAGSVKKTLVSF